MKETETGLHVYLATFKQPQPCTIHGVVCCAECDAMTDEQRWQMEQHLQNEQWESNMSNLYTYDEDGFCDGFTNW